MVVAYRLLPRPAATFLIFPLFSEVTLGTLNPTVFRYLSQKNGHERAVALFTENPQSVVH